MIIRSPTIKFPKCPSSFAITTQYIMCRLINQIFLEWTLIFLLFNVSNFIPLWLVIFKLSAVIEPLLIIYDFFFSSSPFSGSSSFSSNSFCSYAFFSSSFSFSSFNPMPFLFKYLKSNFLFLFQPVRRVAVIGAGVSGLCCARRFTEPHVRDKFELVIYEQTDRVGGTWVYTPQVGIDENTGLPVHSSMYENLRCV